LHNQTLINGSVNITKQIQTNSFYHVIKPDIAQCTSITMQSGANIFSYSHSAVLTTGPKQFSVQYFILRNSIFFGIFLFDSITW